MATKKKSKQKPAWERAYKGHVLWLGKAKLGKVTLADKGRYTWEAAGRAGAAEDLDKAKKAVEMAVATADKQLDLFNG
jgi:VCBS repeat-containing protein